MTIIHSTFVNRFFSTDSHEKQNFLSLAIYMHGDDAPLFLGPTQYLSISLQII